MLFLPNACQRFELPVCSRDAVLPRFLPLLYARVSRADFECRNMDAGRHAELAFTMRMNAASDTRRRAAYGRPPSTRHRENTTDEWRIPGHEILSVFFQEFAPAASPIGL